jgi:hypothetical protein
MWGGEGSLPYREEELFHVLEQELLSAGLPKVESVVVDQLLLSLQPFAPANTADLIEGSPAELVLEGLKGHPVPFLAAPGTLNHRHEGKIDTVRNVIQCIGRFRKR